MKISFATLWAIVPAFALIVAGCSESTTQKDVAKAQKDLQDARQNTHETIQEGQQDVAAAQRDTRDHVVNKPVTPGEVADTRHDANQNIADAKEKERAAAADLKVTEQKFAATQEKDAFVKQAEQSLASYDKRIDELKQQASAAEGATKDAINRQIDAVKSQRDRADSALSDLKKADLATWKSHENHVRMAFQDLDNSMKNVR